MSTIRYSIYKSLAGNSYTRIDKQLFESQSKNNTSPSCTASALFSPIFVWWARGMVWGRLLFYRVDLFLKKEIVGVQTQRRIPYFPVDHRFIDRVGVVLVSNADITVYFFGIFFFIPSSFYCYSYVHSSIDSLRKLHGEFAFFNAHVGTHAALTWTDSFHHHRVRACEELAAQHMQIIKLD